MKYNITTALAALMLAAPCAMAEDIDTEIAIERQVVPEHRSATRLNLLPELQLPAVKQMRLNPSDRITAINIPAYVTTLDPTAYATSAEPYPWRGYAAIGYFPAFNLGASAGYRILDRSATTLDAWLQYDGASWNGDIPAGMAGATDTRLGLHSHTATIGTALTQRFGSRSALAIDLEYSYANWNAPDATANNGVEAFNHHLNRLNFNAGWQSRTSDRFAYHASLGYGLMAFGLPDPDDKMPSENTGRLNLGLDWNFAGKWSLLTDIDGDVNIYNTPGQAFTKGNAVLRPRVEWNNGKFAATLGLDLDIYFHGGTTDYNGSTHGFFYPRVNLAWTPSGSFSIWGQISGKTYNNSYAELYDWCRYVRPVAEAAWSKTIDFEGGITLGPWRGASLELFGGFSAADAWITPYAFEGEPYRGHIMMSNLDGVHYGMKLSYRYRSLLEIRGKVEGAAHSDDDIESGWYRWRDRARWDIDVALDIHPIKPLTITVGHNWRTGRRCTTFADSFREVYYTSLGNVSSLRLAAAYRITDAFSVFARGENILNHRHCIMPGIPAQGVAGLVGITYKLP